MPEAGRRAACRAAFGPGLEQGGVAAAVVNAFTTSRHPVQSSYGPAQAPDRRAREAGIRPVGVAIKDDVPVMIGEEELHAVLPRDPPDRREARGLLVEMRSHGGREVLGHVRLCFDADLITFAAAEGL